MKTYKTKKTVLKHVKEFLENYSNWVQEGEFYVVPEGVDKNGPSLPRDLFDKCMIGEVEVAGEWAARADEARAANERCKVCVMGAVKLFAHTESLALSIIDDLNEETKRAGYKHMRYGRGRVKEIFEINDGAAHQLPKNAWKATLKIIDRTLAKAT